MTGTLDTPDTPNIIVRDSGFAPEDWSLGFTPAAEATGDTQAIDLPADSDLAGFALWPALRIIRIPFTSFADGRGFTLARRLRLMGFQGRLRAHGHVIADQYAMARRSGFDEVEIDAALAARQPQAQWQARADWRAHDYQARLRG